MTGLRERVATVAGIAFGAMWTFAAAAKVAQPGAAFDLAARATPDGLPPKILLAAAVGAEAALGVAMLTRTIRGLGPSLAALVAVSAALLVVRAEVGDQFPCGCFGGLMGATLDVALTRNAGIAAIHVALLAWAFAGRTRSATG